MQTNFNLRMGTVRLVNSQPRLVRPGVNLNYIPDNFNNQAGYGYVQRYPTSGLTYRTPVYRNVYQHLPEEYHQPYDDQLVSYVEARGSGPVPNPQWSQSDYFQYLDERANHLQVLSQPNYQPLPDQVDHPVLEKTTAVAPPFGRQSRVQATKKYNSNCVGSVPANHYQQPQNSSKNVRIVRRQNQPMAMLPPPKPLHRRADEPVQNLAKKQKTLTGSRSEAQQKILAKPNQAKQQCNKIQPTNQSPVIKKELYLHVGKVERDRALVGIIPQLFKWRSARYKLPPVYETVGIIEGRQEVVDKKQKIEDQFVVRNMKQWNRNVDSSMHELIECVVYTSAHGQKMYSVGTCVRIVGRFIANSQIFHCLKIRQATESDFNHLTCIFKGLAIKTVNVEEPLGSIAMTTEANEQEQTVNDLDVHPVALAHSDFLFQPY